MLISLEKSINILWVKTDVITFLTNEPKNWYILYSYLKSNILRKLAYSPVYLPNHFPVISVFFFFQLSFMVCV